MNTGVDEERDHVPRRRAGHPALPRASRSTSWPRSRPSSRSPTSSSTVTCRTKTELAAFSERADPALDDPRGHEALLRRLSRRPRTRWRSCRPWCCSLSSFYPQALDVKNKQEQEATIARLLSKMRTIAAFSYKKSIGQPFVYPKNNLSYCANFLNMMFSVPAEPYEIDEDIVKVLNLLLILHADHEQNCSTSTVRQVGSSQANLFASISAGICALWGPLHGGANEEVLDDARGDQGRRQRPEEVRRPRQGEGLGLPADGLRPPRLQELRPAREDHQGGGRQGHEEDEAPRPAARHRQGRSRRRRCRTATSSSESSTRTSTSTAASSTARSASRRTCSPSCSPSAARPAGSRTGRR